MTSCKALRPSALVTLLLVAGCAHYPDNPQLKKFDYTAGYRFGNSDSSQNSDELFIVLCFSGGGTRAAAFSYGVLEELNRTPNPLDPLHRPLLDDVDVISSVSGGSFTAAYYGLYGKRIFADYERAFLKKDVEGALVLEALSPPNWYKLASPWYSRIDLAADYYDREIFHGKTFTDLARRPRPFLMINATDMSLGSRFEFTQDQFDQIYSDLSSVHVARAVAASSAFPVLLAPMTLNNHQPGPDYKPPALLEHFSAAERELSPRDYQRAKDVQSYVNVESKPFVHLIDGGIADNIGLRGVWQSIESPDVLAPQGKDVRGLSINRLINTGKIKYLAVIVVNAKPGDIATRDRSASTPGVFDVVSSVATMPMSNYSFDTVQLMRQTVDEHRRMAKLIAGPSPWKDLSIFCAEVSFEGLRDSEERKALQALGTNYHLKDAEVDHLRQAGARLLTESGEFRDLLAALNAEARRRARAATRP